MISKNVLFYCGGSAIDDRGLLKESYIFNVGTEEKCRKADMCRAKKIMLSIS